MNPLKTMRLAAWILSVAVGAGSALAAPVSARRANGAPNVPVTGVVTDGSGHAWPLYARVEITSESTAPLVVYTDAVTGAYAADLADGVAYTFAVTAIAPGYALGGGPVVTAGAPIVANWTLIAGALCSAPGYAPGTFGTPVFTESFDAGVLPPGWSVQTVSGASWQITEGADPCELFPGNDTGGSGPYAIINSNCGTNFFEPEDTYLVTPPIDLSSSSTAAIQWANEFADDVLVDSLGEVQVSIDGGTTWTTVYSMTSISLGPETLTADMSFAAGHTGVLVRFHYNAFFGYWWQVDDVAIRPFTCTLVPGGLVLGNVSDANTGLGLNGATVTPLAGGDPATTAAAPGQGDGFYFLFAAGSGSQSFEATADLHNPQTKDATVVENAIAHLNFSLPAGFLDASPRPLSVVMSPGATQSLTLDVTNSGSGDGTFHLHEVDVAPAAKPGARRPSFAFSLAERQSLRRQFTLAPLSAKGAKSGLTAPLGTPAAAGAGNIVQTFPTGFTGGYGLAYDTDTNRLWVANSDAVPAGLTGDGLDYEYLPDGTQTGQTIQLASGLWAGDGTYNARTGMIWQVDVGYIFGSGYKCLFEIDPVTKAVTGKQICGPWGDFPAQIGLAYDYATDTYYVGDQLGVISHIDSAGNLLDSGHVSVQISGLAYNPTTKHLFVQVFSQPPFDVYVLDPGNGYAILSGSSVTVGGVPTLGNRGVSLEADCSGHLWTYDIFNNVVYEYESGETGWCVGDIPWLSENPTSGTVAGSGGGSAVAETLPITVTFDSTGLLPGLRLRSLVFTTDTPTPVAPVPVDLTVLFGDVPTDSFAANYIYGAAGAGVMPGCSPQAPLYAFCPAEVVTRRSMAAYIERAAHGALVPPPVYPGQFNDVLLGSFNADYIQGLVQDHITAGCGVNPPLYCPDVPVTRAQMAVFVWKGQHGEEPPPACTPPGTFADVPCPDGFAVDFVEGIYAEGITAGCGNGNYCPNASITSAQMAVFLVKAFALPYLP